MSTDLKRVESLFEATFELSSLEERQAYLSQACAGDQTLRRCVEALLHAHECAGDFLREPFLWPCFEEATPSFQNDAAPSMDPTSVPRVIGDYQLLEELARGGMGIVYKAQQRSLNRLVALKLILSGQFAHQAELRRFHNEARAAASLDHPNIVPIYEVGEHQGQHFFTMKLIDGSNLHQQLPRLRHDPCASARLLALVARAVHHAHQRGILHRDLKPSNILLDAQGQPHVVDFGVSKCIQADDGLTALGLIVGTPAYMAPEQAQGERELTTAGDVYSLGAILYHLLTGQPPFGGATALETLRQLLEHDPLPPRKLNLRVPQDLETICLKCLEKLPAQRYGSAEALAEDLERFLAHEPILARQSACWERVLKWSRRSPTVAMLAGVLLLVATMGIVLVFWQWGRAEQANRELRQTAWELEQIAQAERLALAKEELARKGEVQALQQAQHHLQRARTHLYFSRVNVAHGEWLANRIVGGVTDLLDRCPADQLGWEWHYLQRLCNRDLWRVHAPAGEFHGLAYHPSGRYLAFAGGDRTVQVHEAATGKRVQILTGHTGVVSHVAFSPDGKLLASSGRDQTVKIWAIPSWECRHTLRGHQGGVWANVFSPDSRWLASAGEDRTVKLWEVESGKQLACLTGNASVIRSLAFHPDGRRLAVATGNTVKFWDTLTQAELLALKGERGAYLSVAFSPEGTRLATANGNQMVQIWDTQGQLLHTCRGHTHQVVSLAFSPDGKRLASAGDTTVRIWDVASGTLEDTLRGFRSWVWRVAFSPEGHQLATGEGFGLIRIWDVCYPQHTWRRKRHDQTVTACAMSPDGQLVASAAGRRLVVWEVNSAKEQYSWDNPSEIRRLAFGGSHSLVWADSQGRVLLWQMTRDKQPRLLLDQAGSVSVLLFDPSNRCLVSANRQGTLHLWEVSQGKLLWTRQGHSLPIQDLMIRPDGRRLVSLAMEWNRAGEVKEWELPHGEPIETIPLQGVVGLSAKFTPEGRQIVTSDYYGAVRVWDLATPSSAPPRVPAQTMSQSFTTIHALGFSPDGRRLVGAGADFAIRLWDPVTGEPALTIPTNNSVHEVSFGPKGHLLLAASGSDVTLYDGTPTPLLLAAKRAAITCAAFSPDGRTLVLGNKQGELSWWEMPRLLMKRTQQAHQTEIAGLAFSPDGQTLVSISQEGIVKCWKTRTAVELLTRAGPRARCAGISFLDQGKTLLTLEPAAPWVRCWSLPEGNEQKASLDWPETLQIRSLALWGTRAAVLTEQGRIEVRNLLTGARERSFAGQAQQLTCLSFCSQGELLAWGDRDGSVTLWQRDTTPPWSHLQCAEGISALAVLHGGRLLAVGTNSGMVQLWEVQTRTKRGQWYLHEGPVTTVVFSPEGRTLATTGREGSARVWDLQTLGLLSSEKGFPR